ncbi:MAG: Fe-S protein assembly chaperone HscA [Pseudomonadota bacterium]
MSLLQIAEPGESLRTDESRNESRNARAIGIDLGTTNSLVAYVAGGVPVVIPDEKGRVLLPSVVHYGKGGGVLVGQEAKEIAARHPTSTISSVKRLMGRSPQDNQEAVGALLAAYELAARDGKVVRLSVADGERVVTPVEVSAEILKVLKERAERAFAGNLAGAVITVPAYFDDAQRQATKDAGRLAGLEVLRLLNEPTAAALAYGLEKGSQGTYAVYDLGGGTFDISILKLVDGVFEVQATGGDSALGGDDFDRTFATAITRELGEGERRVDRALLRRVLDASRVAREDLTLERATRFAVTLANGKVFERTMTRDELDHWIRPIVEKTGSPCRRALKDAGLSPQELDGVILVGGATRTPLVRAFVRSLFEKEPLGDIDPDQVVAMGAAAQASILVEGSSRSSGKDVLLLDVIPLSLGIETMGGVVERIIPRNSTIPIGATQVFTTFADNQTGFDIHVLQGERDTVENCRSLARFALKGLPPMPAGIARVRITFLVDADGLLRVMAREETTGIETAVEVKPSYGLGEEQIEKMLLDAYEHAEEDRDARLLLTERVEADRVLAATRTALAEDRSLCDLTTQAAVERAIGELEHHKTQDDYRAIRTAIQNLDDASRPLAEKRMNRAIAQAMQGKKVEEIEREVD